MVQRTRCSPAPCGGDAAGARGHFPSQRRQVVKSAEATRRRRNCKHVRSFSGPYVSSWRRRDDETPLAACWRYGTREAIEMLAVLLASPRRRDAAAAHPTQPWKAFLLAGICVPGYWEMRSRWLGNAFLLAGICVHSRARSRSLRTNASARAHKHTRTHTHTGAGGRRGGLLPHFALGRLSSAGVAPRARALRVCVCVRASVYCRNVEVLLSKKIRSRRSSLRLEQDAITRSVRACARVEH